MSDRETQEARRPGKHRGDQVSTGDHRNIADHRNIGDHRYKSIGD